MPIPDFQTIMLPLLKFVSDSKEHSFREAVEHLANFFNLTPDEKQAMLPSGTQEIFSNRVGWAKTHLQKAGLLESPRRSFFKITERGLQVLQQNPDRITIALLKQFKEYLEFIKPSYNQHKQYTEIDKIESEEATPLETLENAYHKIRKALASELLNKVKTSSPAFFEKLVVELLVKMGYGGSLKDSSKVTRFIKDDGIDGIIKEDKLGLDLIYIQAKRWDNQAVGIREIQSFVGALDGQKANKGIFFTTSYFSESAIDYVKNITKRVILIDGEQLANYMIDYGLGVSTVARYELKKIDNDYFDEESS